MWVFAVTAETSVTSSFPIEEAASRLKVMKPQERLAWGKEQFGGGFAATTSFGIQSAVLLHMVWSLPHPVPIIWIDTGYLPPETYRYADQLCRRFTVDLHIVQSSLSPARMFTWLGSTGSIFFSSNCWFPRPTRTSSSVIMLTYY